MTQAVRSAAQVQVQVKVKAKAQAQAQAQAEAKQTEMSTGILSSRDKKYNTRHSIKKGGKKGATSNLLMSIRCTVRSGTSSLVRRRRLAKACSRRV